VWDWTGEPGDAFIRVDFENDGDHSRAAGVDALRHPVTVGCGLHLVLRIDVDGANQPFFPERFFVAHDAGELAQPQSRDFHVCPLVDSP
jgi:hypothetical protein